MNSAALVLLRDEQSLAHLRDLGVRDDHLRVTADVVFSTGDAAALRVARGRGGFPLPRPDGGPPRVAVSVRDWPYFKQMSAESGMAAYRDAIRGAVTFFVERYGARVTFVSTCQGIPEYPFNDARTAEAIVAGLPTVVGSSVTVDHAFHTPGELSALLRDFDLVLATRMHMAILSLCAGTLVFPVAYEFKTKELFDRLGLGEFVKDIEGLSADALVSTLRVFLDDAARVRETMFTGVEVERQRAVASVAMVRAALGGTLQG